MRKIFFILAVLLCGCFTLKAQEFTYDNLNYRVTGTNPPTVELTGHTEGFTAHDFVTPSTVTYEGTTYSVTSIGNGAFYNCSGLTGSLTIGNSVTSIGSYVFDGCSGFTGDLTIGNSVTSIGDYVFHECSGFTGSLTIGNSVTSIGNGAFSACSGLTSSLTIPNSVTSIGELTFAFCSGLTGDLTIPNSVTSIGGFAFQYCSGFTGDLTIGNSVTSIEYYAFEGCSGFTGNLTIGNSVTSIGDHVFDGCSGFTGNLIIPNFVESIGNYAFVGCSGLTGVLTIGTSVLSIGEGAFKDSQFTHFIAKPGLPPALDTDAFNSGKLQSIFVPCDSESYYKEKDGWKEFADKMRENFVMYDLNVTSSDLQLGTVSITEYCECTSFSSTVAATPASGNCHFTGWTENGEVVSTSNPYTFTLERDCNLVANFFRNYDFSATCSSGQTLYYRITNAEQHTVSIVAPNSDDWQGWNGFDKPTGDITLPATARHNSTNYTVTAIGNYAFRACDGLTGSLTIPNSVTSIGNSAFYHCSGFTGSLTIPNSVTSIGDNAFDGCSGFTGSLIIPDAVTSIGTSAFNGCKHFTGSLVIPDAVTSIGFGAFQNCQGFTGSLTISNAVTSIGQVAFNGCSGFTGTLTIGSSVSSIENYAFANCSGFTHIIAKPDTPPTLGNDVFFGITELPSITVPCGKDGVYKTATGWSSYASIIAAGFVYDLTVASANPVFGSASITRQPDCNTQAEVSATPAPNCLFTGWTENGMEVSTDNPYTFTMTGDRNLVANFYNQYEFTAIRYTSANHEVVTPYASDVFGANIQSNVYDTVSDQGIIVFDGDVTSIGDNAFYECTNLTSITIPRSVTSIGDLAFFYCTSLASIDIPSSVTRIKQNAFYSCMGLTSITIPSSVTSIEPYTFSCSGLTSITIPSTVTSIGWAAFTYCTNLTSINIPENVTFIDGFAFDNCSSLTSINIPDNVTSIEKYTFNNCSSLTSIAIPSTVTRISEYAFSGCSGLTSISLPNGLLSLESFSFDNCTGLTSFTIPSSVTSIGDGILSSCTSLQSVAVESGNTVYDSRDNCNAIIETATNTMIAGFTFSDFPTSVTAIGNYAFYGCMGLTSMTIPSTVTKLGDAAFSGCRNLVSIVIPSTVTKLGDGTFSGCRNLASITIPNSVESIGNNAFYYCSSLTSISLPNSLISLGNYSFDNCTGLTSITIPNGSIGNRAFHGCSGLESVILQDGVTSIGDFAFCECASLSSVVIPGSVASIGIYAFQDCRSLTSITIPNGTIGMWAFYGCSELESVILQDGVTSIGDFAFYGRTKLPSITIPGSVESIGMAAFNGCSGLESVILQDGVKSIGEAAFYDCTKLPSVTIPSSVESIGGSAFDGCNFANIISKAETAPTLASKIPNASNNVYIPAGALQSYRSRWSGFGYNFIEQDRESCTFNGNSSNVWSDASNWEENAVPTKKCPSVFINADCQVDADAEVGAIIVAAGMTLTVDTGKNLKPDGITLEDGVQLINNGTVNCNAITLEDGAQLFNNGTVNSSKLTVKKDITGYDTGTGNWYLVSPPVDKDGYYWYPNMLTSPEGYDLYRFDQAGDSQGNEWLNYKAGYFELENQRGYLYASKNNRTIVFSGVFADTETKTLAYDANAKFAGFNLVGNPFPCNATISGTNLRSSNYFYKMNALGTALEVVVNPIIAPCTGVFAVAANSDATVTFAQASATANVTRGEKSSLQDIRVELLANGKTIDRAFLNMNGESLPKFSLQDNTSEICFCQNGEELAVASTDATRGVMPLNFKAAKTGTYTLTANAGSADLNYLHLVDNMTGDDIDLFSTPSHTFNASVCDDATRFKLVFGMKNANPESDFAYISNGEIVVSSDGRATLLVIDMLGRVVGSHEINGEGRVSTQGMAAGVYVLNLNGMTQKIVVR